MLSDYLEPRKVTSAVASSRSALGLASRQSFYGMLLFVALMLLCAVHSIAG